MRNALIIGNTDGIGLELTEQLLVGGWRVTGVSRRASRVSAPAYTHHVIDVCAPDYRARLAPLVEPSGGLDVCVYCAGIGEFLDVDTLAEERRVFDTNLIGAVVTAQAVVPALIRQGRGHLIGLSSQADAFPDARAPSYSASKAGLSTYLAGLAAACRARGVAITHLRLGFVDTKMAKAPVRPFMVSPAHAAARVRRAIERRPVRDTYPKRMAVLLWLARIGWSVQGALRRN